jgi:hypothetical protein
MILKFSEYNFVKFAINCKLIIVYVNKRVYRRKSGEYFLYRYHKFNSFVIVTYIYAIYIHPVYTRITDRT